MRTALLMLLVACGTDLSPPDATPGPHGPTPPQAGPTQTDGSWACTVKVDGPTDSGNGTCYMRADVLVECPPDDPTPGREAVLWGEAGGPSLASAGYDGQFVCGEQVTFYRYGIACTALVAADAAIIPLGHTDPTTCAHI